MYLKKIRDRMTLINPRRRIWATILSNFELKRTNHTVSKVVKGKWCVLWPQKSCKRRWNFLNFFRSFHVQGWSQIWILTFKNYLLFKWVYELLKAYRQVSESSSFTVIQSQADYNHMLVVNNCWRATNIKLGGLWIKPQKAGSGVLRSDPFNYKTKRYALY